ncbi:receptor-type tyrosine-protein phosphatase H-like [Eucyclogobius newberryi]|uniref:receptor-type tyrosine-protein phosphatase H-like n=1 Tax=Eucyclogobius newberryi TaxID=166745 RepID=UPI003B59E853
MDYSTFRFTAYSFLLVFNLSLFWRGLDCQGLTTNGTTTIPVTTQSTTTLKPPENVKNVTVTQKTETTVTIVFDKVEGVNTYDLSYIINGAEKTEQITWSPDTPVRHQLVGLMPAHKYNMTLRSKVGDLLSSGFSFTAITAPENVETFTAVGQSESSITLQWTKKTGVQLYILKFDGIETDVTEEDSRNYVVPNLSSATAYNVTLYSVFEGIRSTGANLTAATAPSKAKDLKAVKANETSITLQWMKDNSIYYTLRFNGKEINITAEELGNPAQYTVSNLQNTTRYNFTLVPYFRNIPGAEVSISAATAPRKVERFGPVNQSETSITLQWEPVPGVIEYILHYENSHLNISGTNEKTVSGLTSGTLFNLTLFAVFESVRSIGAQITAATVPRNPTGFKAEKQSETSITLEWDKVGDIQDYVLNYGSKRVPVTSSGAVVTHEVTGLESGTLYNFTLSTEFANLSSSGILQKEPTVPPRVSEVKVTERDLTTVTLQWPNVRKDWNYSVVFSDSANSKMIREGDFVSFTVTSLKPGTVYTFAIVTEFAMLMSIPFQIETVTVIDCTIVDWSVTETSIQGKVNGAFTDATASNGSQPHPNSGFGGDVKFTGLYPGANYSMKLLYKGLEQCNHALTIIPPPLMATCKNWDAGYSIYIEWKRPSGVWDSVEVNVSDKVHKVGHNEELYAEISNVQPAKKYKVSISSLSGPQRSKPYVFECATDARGVIAGAFFGVLLFLALVCVVVFIMLRRTNIIRKHKKSLNGANRTSVKKPKWIPLDRFPCLFNELSADENKGFSLEYEDLAVVGTEQSQKAATIQENKSKNRFINVLPYDHSRVRLTSSSPHNDYINASYIPGYNSKKEFIAAQGPLPSTVRDFWRMVWEQKVRGIVMVTNCTEGGRIKCEQYWPDSNAHVGGDLEVFTTSEQKEPDWTLREFKVKHRHTSEERTVRHFHFTAWPDHGVPQGTQLLIQFRALVRRHMQTEAAGAPTVVHCSAGVGRTGTIIALDVLLQQMETEKAVDINGFVHKMRLNRPHMVQTESQYMFLHQCILDRLLLNEKPEENIYENELIYANASAIRDFQNMNKYVGVIPHSSRRVP